MEVYQALDDHIPGDNSGSNVLLLRRGDRVEVLEDEHNRHHREWWGVRRLRDHVLGYVPSKCLTVSIDSYTEKLKKLYL